MVFDLGFGLGGPLLIAAIFFLASAIRVLREVERGVVFQLGSSRGAKGPGFRTRTGQDRQRAQ